MRLGNTQLDGNPLSAHDQQATFQHCDIRKLVLTQPTVSSDEKSKTSRLGYFWIDNLPVTVFSFGNMIFSGAVWKPIIGFRLRSPLMVSRFS